MESITIKVENEFAREIDRAMRPHYSTKTEFIREAIRDKIKEITKEELEKVRGDAIDEPLSCYTTYNILLPRKYHMNVVRGIETPGYSDPRKEEYKTCLGDTIHSFKKKFGAELSPAENETVKSWKKDQRIKAGEASTLSWQLTDADEAEISGIGKVITE
jgi:predicted transcriptional regulator